MNHARGGVFVKILLYLAIIMLLVGGTLFFVVRQLDPKDFNLDVQAILSRYLGRELTINGTIRYSYFPWLGVAAQDVTVAQPEGFGDKPFLRIKGLELRIKLLPLLLDKKIVLGRVLLDEPDLLLIRNKQGTGNWKQWAFLNKNNASVSTTNGETTYTLDSLTARGVEVHKGKLVWSNQRSGNYYDVTQIELATDSGLRFNYTLSCDYFSKLDNATGTLRLRGEGLARPELEELELRNTDAEFTSQVPGEHGRRNYFFQGHGNMLVLSEVADLDHALLKLDEATLEGSLQGKRVFSDDIAISGKVRARDVRPKKLLGPDASPAALKLLHNATAEAAYSLKENILQLTDVDADLSGTQVTGIVTMDAGDPKGPLQWTANCSTPELDLEALFPQKAPKKNTDPAAEKQILPGETLEELRTLGLNLKLHAQKILWRKRPATDVYLHLSTADGRAELKAKAGNFCQGSLQGAFQSGKQNRKLQVTLSGADTSELFKAPGAAPLAGKGKISLDASFSGNTLGELAATLQADLTCTLADGRYAADTQVWPFSSLDVQLGVKAAASDKTVVRPFAVRGTLRYKGLPPWLQAPRAKAEAPVAPAAKGLSENALNLSLRGAVQYSLADLTLRAVENAAAHVHYKGHAGKSLDYRFVESEGSGTLSYDLLFDTLDVRQATLSALGCNFRGTAHGTGLSGPAAKRVFTGSLTAEAARPRAALRNFKIELPTPRSAEVYKNWRVSTAYQLDNDALQCENLRMRLDKAKLQGKFGVYGLSKSNIPPFITFDLNAGTLDLDAYRPLEKKHAPGYAPQEKNWDPETIRNLNLDGRVSIATFQFLGLNAANLQAKITASAGKLHVGPLKSRFYNGDLSGWITVEAPLQSNKLVLTTECNAVDFQIGPMLNALGADDEATGTGTLEARLACAGRNNQEALKTLGGRVAFVARDGSIGIKRTSTPPSNSNRRRRRSRESLFNLKKPAASSPKTTRTKFNTAHGAFDIAQGIMRNKDFQINSTLIQAHGNGLVNLPDKNIDYTITVQMTGAPSIPIRISGPLHDPGVSVTQSGMLTDTAERIGGSIFNVFEGIYTLPFKIFHLLQ